MADAMCGPSNPLQQFKQQTDVDRTLQQDRLSSRHSPAQGFRSHNPNTGLIDHEFEAFQAGVGPPVLDHAPPFQRPAGFGGPSQAPSWATDFQRLQISPQPMQHQPQHFQPGPSNANWASGFQDYLAHNAPKAQTSSPSPLAFQQRARGYGGMGFQSSFPQQSYTPAMQSKGKEPVAADQWDEAAFAKAFDQAHDDMMAVEENVEETAQTENIEELVEKIEQAAEQGASQMLNESNQDLDDLEQAQMHRIHSSDIEHEPQQEILREEQQTEHRQQHDDDALAATAQELLEKVEHNQSDKFRNSQFLDLMRKLRDREVRVEGDKMVETANASSTSIADDALNDSSTNTNAQRVYYGKPQPVPLAASTVDSRPPEYGGTIPPQEQDHDPGRINATDGQEVVDLLNERGAVTDDMDSEFLMTSPFYQP